MRSIYEVPRSATNYINRVAPIQGDLMDIDVSTIRDGRPRGVINADLSIRPRITAHGFLVSPRWDTPGPRSPQTIGSRCRPLSRDTRVESSTYRPYYVAGLWATVCGSLFLTNRFPDRLPSFSFVTTETGDSFRLRRLLSFKLLLLSLSLTDCQKRYWYLFGIKNNRTIARYVRPSAVTRVIVVKATSCFRFPTDSRKSNESLPRCLS